MAKSKNGGTRAYIRGRIGSDVYSVGKNSKGQKQQVVRSLAETVANPRSTSQMFGRMVMSTVMQAVSAFKPIIDHSFDGLAVGQPSISEFIRRNYALVKADAIAHPATGNKFGLNKYQEKGVKEGMWNISNGAVVVPAAFSASDTDIYIQLTEATATVGGLKAAMGLSAEGYVTWVGLDGDGKAFYFRARLNTTLADDTALTAENVPTMFTFEGNIGAGAAFASNTVALSAQSSDSFASMGMIISEKVNGAWAHSTCTLSDAEHNLTSTDVALPTYPTGSKQFLNGGDI